MSSALEFFPSVDLETGWKKSSIGLKKKHDPKVVTVNDEVGFTA